MCTCSCFFGLIFGYIVCKVGKLLDPMNTHNSICHKSHPQETERTSKFIWTLLNSTKCPSKTLGKNLHPFWHLSIHLTMLRQSQCFTKWLSYWNSIGLEMRLHKQEHGHKNIWIMLGVKWLASSLALSFIAHFHLGSHEQYENTLLPLLTGLVSILQPHSF